MTRAMTTYTVGGAATPCWCDIAQVSLMTGKTVDDATMVRAQMVIENYTECFADALPRLKSGEILEAIIDDEKDIPMHFFRDMTKERAVRLK